MTTQEVANRYYELAKIGQFQQIIEEFYSPDILSFEPKGAPMESIQGMEAYLNKSKAFEESVEEMHGGYTNEPIVSEYHFAVSMGMEVTFKGMGRVKMDEICVFKVKDGKITEEHFFYNTMNG